MSFSKIKLRTPPVRAPGPGTIGAGRRHLRRGMAAGQRRGAPLGACDSFVSKVGIQIQLFPRMQIIPPQYSRRCQESFGSPPADGTWLLAVLPGSCSNLQCTVAGKYEVRVSDTELMTKNAARAGAEGNGGGKGMDACGGRALRPDPVGNFVLPSYSFHLGNR